MGVRALPCGLDYDQFPLRLIQILGGRLLSIMILEVPQLQVIDRLRDYSSCASDAMGLRLSLRGSGVRFHCRGSGACVFVRGFADMSYDCAFALRGSGARVSVCGYADMGKYCALALFGLVLVFISVVAQRQLPWSAYSADHRDCPVAAH